MFKSEGLPHLYRHARCVEVGKRRDLGSVDRLHEEQHTVLVFFGRRHDDDQHEHVIIQVLIRVGHMHARLELRTFDSVPGAIDDLDGLCVGIRLAKAGGKLLEDPDEQRSARFTQGAGRLQPPRVLRIPHGEDLAELAVFRPSMARWYKDANGNGTYDGIAGGDESFIFGATGDIPIAGNWNGDSIDDIGVYRPSNSYFYQDFNDSNSFQPGIDLVIRFGAIGDIPFIGNWNGSATDNIAVFRPATSMVYRDVNGNGSFDAGDSATQFGTAGDQPIAGDWALPTPLLAPTAANESENTVALTSEALTGVADAAIEILVGAGISADELSNINFQIADLTGRRLGQTLGNTITIDVNAAGHGWFVDTSPTDHHEFSIVGRNGLVAEESTLPADHMDLLTVLLHELGHTLNLADDYSSADSANLMSGLLTAGIRRLPTEGELAAMMFDA